MLRLSLRFAISNGLTSLFAIMLLASAGCHDGPLYALKHANPYFAMKEWRDDAALGVTDHERRNELLKLTDQIGSMPANRQAFWTNHLKKMMDNDPSPEMRRLAVNAAGKVRIPAGLAIVKQGLEDDNTKVRMEACRALGRRPEQEAVQLLASTAGKASDQDVKHSALAALGNHKGRMSLDSLRLALNDRDPATRNLAMNSLKQATGKDLGGNPAAWLKAIRPSTPSPAGPPQRGGDVQIATGGGAFSLPSGASGGAVSPASASSNGSSQPNKPPLFR